MRVFNFYRKTEGRQYYEVEAETLEEAQELIEEELYPEDKYGVDTENDFSGIGEFYPFTN